MKYRPCTLVGQGGTGTEEVDVKRTVNDRNATHFPGCSKVVKDPQTENWTHFLNVRRGFTKYK
jgi:hypothetical protein